MSEIKLLDCTLRDGGYLNDWEFGNSDIINVFERLVSAGIDIIEIGFIDDRRVYDVNRTIFPDTEAVNHTYEKLNKGTSLIVGMIDYGTCCIENIQPCSNSYLDGIRVIFKKERMYEALDFCRKIKELGYKTFVQAVSITSYNGEELEELVELVNLLSPYAFSLVDTYGLLHKGQLLHYYRFACEHLNPMIGIGYHAHNNFQLAYANCIDLLQEPPSDRMLIVDGSLYGMGKSAGNTPIELLATYMNEYEGTSYLSSQLMEAIEVTILEIRRRVSWGYSFKFFLAASHDCHPNYVSYLTDIGKLSVKSINDLLDRIIPEKKLLYDAAYIRDLYLEYQKEDCNDSSAYEALRDQLHGRVVLLLGPGKNIYEEQELVYQYIEKHAPLIISINFIPQGYEPDYVFMSNAKRYVQMSSALNAQRKKSRLIATSNVTRTEGEFDYTLNYSNLLDASALIPDNPLVMLLSLLDKLGVAMVGLAGFDGYTEATLPNYVNPNMEYILSHEQAEKINQDTINAIQRLHLSLKKRFVTTSRYTENEM